MATTYSGDPTKFPEAVTLYDDSVPPTGSNINRAPQANLDRTAYLRAKFDTVAAANFHDPSSGTSFGLTGSINNIGGFGYDPSVGAWQTVVTAHNGGNYQIALVETLNGKTWSLVTQGSGTTDIVGCMSSPGPLAQGFTTRSAIALLNLDGSTLIPVHRIGGGGDALASTLAFAGTNAVIFPLLLSTPLPVYVTYYVNQGATTFVGKLEVTTNQAATAWNDRSSAAPAAFQGGTNHVGAIHAASGFDATGFPVVLVAIEGATPGTDTTHLMSISGVSSLLPTDQTQSFMTGQSIRGIAYQPGTGAGFGTWGLLTVDGSGTFSFYTTTDYTGPWTLAWQTTSGGATAIAAIGGLWVISLTTGQVIFSADVPVLGSSSTWHFGSVLQPTVHDGVNGLFSNGVQLLASDGTTVSVSLQAGLP